MITPDEAQLAALLADAPKADDHDGMRDYLHALAGAGLSVLLVIPGTKAPFDGRTSCKKTSDDKAAQKDAEAAGRRNWQKVKSPAGVHLASAEPKVLDGYLDEYTKVHGEGCAVNVAVSVGRSRLVVVDCDTADQVAAFLADVGAPADTPPTVRTPGQLGPDGTMVHSDGGHFYFTVPESVELPEQPESMSVGAGTAYSVFWGPGKYVLVPPSVRHEGCYETAGGVYPLPDWLRDRIIEHSAHHAERAQHSRARGDNGDDPIPAWGATITWAEILTGTGWTPTGKTDACGCDTWTAPGDHASDKSATAHEPGCAQWDSPDPPLHIWTDHDVEPFDVLGRATVTRLQAVAAIHYDNDTGAAMSALDLHDGPVTLGADEDDDEDTDATADESADVAANARRLQITWASEIEPEPVPWLWVDIAARNTWSPDTPRGSSPDPLSITDIACVAPGRAWSPPEVEQDGRIACGMVSIAAGREGSGKSSFGIWLTAKITRGTLPGAHYGTPKRVFYLATEDSWRHTLVPRLIAAGADMVKVGRIQVVVQEGSTVTLSLPDDTALLTQEIVRNDVALVLVDPLMSTLGAGLDANGSRDVRTALEPLAAMADETGAAVVGIAHFNKASGLDALSRITGSGAFKDVARAVMVFADDGDKRVFTQPKNSVGRYDLPSLNYEIQSAVVPTPTGKTSTGVFVFTGVSERSVDDLLADERSRKRPKSPVMTFLLDYVAEHADERTGKVDAADVIAAAEAKGFTRKQIIDARSRCTDPEISTRKEGFGEDARNVWRIER